MRRGGVLGVVVVALAGPAIAGVVPAAGAGRAPVEVELGTEVLVDPSRPSPATATQPAAESRTLVTELAYQGGRRRPRPLVVLAHGHNGNPGKFTELVRAWASAGYVVAAPLFPRSSDAGGGSVADVAEQPADVSFVIDEVLRLARTKGSPLRGRVDPRRIGVAGLSLGGWTTYGVAFHPCCRDERVDAVVLMSGIRGDFEGGAYEFDRLPTLLIHGDADPLYPQSVRAYPDLVAPRWFVTLPGVGHVEAFEDAPSPADPIVGEITVDFWDRYLRGERRAAARLTGAVAASGGLATLEHDLP